MGFHAVSPAPPLHALVESIWDCDMEPAADRLERILPGPNAGLIINLAEDQTRVYTDDASRDCQYAAAPYSAALALAAFSLTPPSNVRSWG